jgi:hypothetical protein
LIDPLALQPALNCSARLRQPLVIAARAELRLINGVSVIAKFDGEHNAMPTPVAAQATLRRSNRAVTGEGIEGRGQFAGGDAPTT